MTTAAPEVLRFPDVSGWQAGLTLPPGTPAVFVKATEGTYDVDPAYGGFRQQAAAIDAELSAYHYLIAGDDPAAQADLCLRVVGTTPTMLDMERTKSARPTVNQGLQFADRFISQGGRLWALYLPEWYWKEIGKPDLTPFAERGLILVSSDYTSDPNAGWSSYGGMTPRIRQYTNAQSYNGMRVDYNLFRGTAAELAALMIGDDMTSAQDVWSYKGDDAGNGGPDTPDVHQSLLTTRDDVAEIKTQMTALAARLEQVAAKVGA